MYNRSLRVVLTSHNDLLHVSAKARNLLEVALDGVYVYADRRYFVCILLVSYYYPKGLAALSVAGI